MGQARALSLGRLRWAGLGGVGRVGWEGSGGGSRLEFRAQARLMKGFAKYMCMYVCYIHIYIYIPMCIHVFPRYQHFTNVWCVLKT